VLLTAIAQQIESWVACQDIGLLAFINVLLWDHWLGWWVPIFIQYHFKVHNAWTCIL